MLDLNRLAMLRAIGVHGSITRAAAALGYTPSAVSQQVTKLERETHAQLLERTSTGVELTPSAWVLIEAFTEATAVLERARGEVEAHRDEPSGRLLVAAFPTACRGFVAGAIADLTTAHDTLDCRLVEADPNKAMAQVTRSEADLAVVHDWDIAPLPRPASLSVAELGDDVADIALPAAHPLAGRTVLTATDLRGERWISQGPGAICHQWLIRFFDCQGLKPDIAYQLEEYASHLALLSAGLGVAMLPRLGRGPLPDGVTVRPLETAPARRVHVVWRTTANRRPAVRAAVAVLRQHWRDAVR